MQCSLDAFSQYTDFSGRATRKQYRMFALFYMLFYLNGNSCRQLTTIYSLVLITPNISITARRLHDISRTGWRQLIYFIPFIGAIVMLVFLCQDSHGENEYGISPKFA